MNKSQLVNAIAETSTVPKSEIKKIVDTLFEITEQTLNSGEKVVISGFGVFSIINTAERIGRNPRTGETVRVPARRNVKFRSSLEIE
jgi:DNA-binding protein HU-beta